MSMTEDEARYDQWLVELQSEHSNEAIKEFTVERLQSYYLKDPLLASASSHSLRESRALLPEHPSAALVFGTTAIEVGLKVVLLKPIVYGLVHDASTAGLITDLAVSHGADKYRNLLFHILSEFGGVDLWKFSRTSSKKPLWEEIRMIQERRNAVLHRAETASNKEAEQSVAIAAVVLEDLFPAVVINLGLHLHNGIRICDDSECKCGLPTKSPLTTLEPQAKARSGYRLNANPLGPGGPK
jgi:hypothetical protein